MFKRGKLTTQERNIIKKHPIYSEQILLYTMKNTKKNILRARIVREHHERVDGTGYPDGKIGSEILLDSKILSIADAFDSMTSPRIYKPNPIKKPIELIKSLIGTHFDEGVFKYAKTIFKEVLKEQKYEELRNINPRCATK
ncbi:MAG: HD domain-containing protein [Clostridiales bacterium]|nr:HD domain-containing protein [Clostridiales bacterium]